MNLQAIYLQTLLVLAPPGHSKFSVTPVDFTPVIIQGSEKNYSEYKWSEFYNSYVRKETEEEGIERYSVIVDSLIKNAQEKLCVDNELKQIPNCKRNPLYKGWKFVELVSIEGAAMIAESGIREDVQFGRGRSKKPSKDGGQGIGPGGEVCLVQIHPTVLAKQNIDPKSFLGSSDEALDNCFGFGMDMFAKSRNMCAWRAAKNPNINHDWVFETFSAYGTGSTCESANNGKTAYRVSLYNKIYSDFSARLKKELKKSNNKVASPTLPLPPPAKT